MSRPQENNLQLSPIGEASGDHFGHLLGEGVGFGWSQRMVFVDGKVLGCPVLGIVVQSRGGIAGGNDNSFNTRLFGRVKDRPGALNINMKGSFWSGRSRIGYGGEMDNGLL